MCLALPPLALWKRLALWRNLSGITRPRFLLPGSTLESLGALTELTKTMIGPVIDEYLLFRRHVVDQIQHQAVLTERAIGIPSEHCIGPLLNGMEVVDEADQLAHDHVPDDGLT